ncbi:hypothetical protein [Paenibacillus piri]|nr:hypothetical protein [Paenibacillus piri]
MQLCVDIQVRLPVKEGVAAGNHEKAGSIGRRPKAVAMLIVLFEVV